MAVEFRDAAGDCRSREREGMEIALVFEFRGLRSGGSPSEADTKESSEDVSFSSSLSGGVILLFAGGLSKDLPVAFFLGGGMVIDFASKASGGPDFGVRGLETGLSSMGFRFGFGGLKPVLARADFNFGLGEPI